MCVFKQSSTFDKIEKVNTQKMLDEYPLENKLRIIFNFHKQLSKKYKEIYDQRRSKEVPKEICIMCEHQVYADKIDLHNSACMARTRIAKD